MKKKNSGKCLLAAAAMLLMVSPSAAQKYKVAKVERTRILIDQRWDAKPDAEAAQFIAPYKNKVDSIMGPVVGSIAHDMTRHRPESELSNLLCDILVWGAQAFNAAADFRQRHHRQHRQTHRSDQEADRRCPDVLARL